MRVRLRDLMQQAWRADKLYSAFDAYARRIGCTVIQDEIICDTDEKAKKLAAWWRDHV